jgi:hypothetical protein
MTATAPPRLRFGSVRRLPSGSYQARYPGPDSVVRPPDDTFATTDAVLHESDGVRVSSPYSCIEMACIQLQAAQYQLWSAPRECTAARLTPIAVASYRAMTALASVIGCLVAADADTTRGAALEHSRADVEVALATLRDALGERA